MVADAEVPLSSQPDISARLHHLRRDIQAIVAGAAVVTPEGAAYKVGVVTAEGAAVEAGVITDEGAAVVDAVALPDDAPAAEAPAAEAKPAADGEAKA